MGLSASQGRLLSLTSRLSDLELQAQTISNSKIRLSQESSQASRNYSDALDKQVLTVYDADTTAYKHATVKNLTDYNSTSDITKQRFIKDTAGNVVVSEAVAAAYDASTNASADALEVFLNYLGYTGNKDQTSATITTRTADGAQDVSTAATSSGDEGTITLSFGDRGPSSAPAVTIDTDIRAVKYDASAVTHYTNLFNEIKESGGYKAPGDDKLKDSEWLTNQIEAGNVTLVEYNIEGGKDGKGDFENVSWTSGDSAIQFKSDKTDLARAEADYEATMADIQTKDKRFDLDLQNINTEHNAVQTQMDSVKKVIDKNIERSFKIFDA